MGSLTFSMIKPDAVARGLTGAILEKICSAGFRIRALKMTRLSREKAGEFYQIHRERPFYGELIDFMSSGPVVACILEKEKAVEGFRTLIGATDPAQAATGTLRKLYAESLGRNAIHGSDSDTNAQEECRFFFPGLEIY